jgi:hypothetical protein
MNLLRMVESDHHLFLIFDLLMGSVTNSLFTLPLESPVK